MLQLTVLGKEYWDSEKEIFSYPEAQTLQLEHSLISLSKWEAKWHKAFLDDKTPKSFAEYVDYIRCMTIKPPKDPGVYDMITMREIQEVDDYCRDPMSATVINSQKKETKKGKSPSKIKKLTSEVIYAEMALVGIPFEPCEKWHLNRLLMTIRVANEIQEPGQKMSPLEVAKMQRAQNAAYHASRKH